MYVRPSARSTKKKGPIGLIIIVIILGLALGGGAWALFGRQDKAPVTAPTTSAKKDTAPAAQKSKPKKIDLQPIVDAWVAKQSGQYSIVIYDPANDVTMASYRPDTQYFTASIYKLFVAYFALEDIDDGIHSKDELFRGEKTRGTCIFDAIHSSDSPCGEALLADIGNDEVNRRLKAYGIVDTSFPAFLTSARDSVTILKRLQAKKDLSPASQDFLLQAMRTQTYRDAIPKGMPQATVADKIGFYETGWHDSALITMPDGREYIMVVLTKNAGSKNIADLATTVYAELIR